MVTNYNNNLYKEYEKTVEKLEETEEKLKKTELRLDVVLSKVDRRM